MRIIGEIDDKTTASRFQALAHARGIECEVDPGEDEDRTGCTVWAIDEDQLNSAEALLNEFLADPNRDEFARDAKHGEKLQHREALQRKKDELAGKVQRTGFQSATTGYVTKALIAFSVVVFILMQLPNAQRVYNALLISNLSPQLTGNWFAALYQVRHGQFWRLVTPIFLHFNFFHILFNMYWLFFLGRLIEARKGSLFLLAFVLVIAIPSNLAQFILSGPLFGGMSGVVYGLFGYIWMKGRFAPREGLALDPTTVVIMLVWLVLGYLGMMNMANTVHTVGLIVGVTWGYLTSTR